MKSSSPPTISLIKRHDTLVALDSDGAVFDTAEIKQKRFFHPAIIKYWQLEAATPLVRRAAEFVNLYSRHRGPNRFRGLLMFFELLAKLPEISEAGVQIPDLTALRRYVASDVPLCHETLAAEIARTNDPELKRVLAWSEEVNREIATKMGTVPPFPGVREAIVAMAQSSDLFVSSRTAIAALEQEWSENGLRQYIAAIAGQEMGSKENHLRQASAGRYAPEKIMMVGDAPADHAAARHVGAWFFPILPDQEEASWQQLREEAYPKFISDQFDRGYQELLLAKFYDLLPEDFS